MSYKVVSLSSWWLRCATLRTSVCHLTCACSPNWAIRYALEGPGIEFRWGRHFLHLSRSALQPTQPPFKWVPDLFTGGKAVGAWRWPPTPSLFIHQYSALEADWQEPESSHVTGVALAHCILGTFLGVVCHCFPLPLDVSTFAASCLYVRNDARDSSSKRGNCGRERCPVILPKFRLPRKFKDLIHAANLRHGADGFTSPQKESVLRIFSPKKSDGFGRVWTHELGY